MSSLSQLEKEHISKSPGYRLPTSWTSELALEPFSLSQEQKVGTAAAHLSYMVYTPDRPSRRQPDWNTYSSSEEVPFKARGSLSRNTAAGPPCASACISGLIAGNTVSLRGGHCKPESVASLVDCADLQMVNIGMRVLSKPNTSALSTIYKVDLLRNTIPPLSSESLISEDAKLTCHIAATSGEQQCLFKFICSFSFLSVKGLNAPMQVRVLDALWIDQ